jgi:hypothetical protein
MKKIALINSGAMVKAAPLETDTSAVTPQGHRDDANVSERWERDEERRSQNATSFYKNLLHTVKIYRHFTTINLMRTRDNTRSSSMPRIGRQGITQQST